MKQQELKTKNKNDDNLIFDKAQLKMSANILTNILLDYANEEFNLEKLTPKEVFGKRRKL